MVRGVPLFSSSPRLHRRCDLFLSALQKKRPQNFGAAPLHCLSDLQLIVTLSAGAVGEATGLVVIASVVVPVTVMLIVPLADGIV